MDFVIHGPDDGWQLWSGAGHGPGRHKTQNLSMKDKQLQLAADAPADRDGSARLL
jgi:hypothetical protein